jgi:hypothetical protein
MAKVEPGGRVRVQSLRMQAFLNGEITVEDLDSEELRKGQFRDRNGGFQGRPPMLIPREFHEAIVREMIDRGEATLRSHMDAAIEVIAKMAMNPKTPARERLAAAQYVLERTAGKIPDKQIVQASVARWQSAMEEVVFDIPDPGPETTAPPRRSRTQE